MRAFILLALAMILTPAAVAAPLPPDKAVLLDFAWLSPPMISPSSAWGDVVRVGDVIRLASRPGATQPQFAWSLRYPVPAEEYPTVVLRYRASRIGQANLPVLAVETSQGQAIPIAQAQDLLQDGSVRELRKQIGKVPPGTMISRFIFALPPAVARLDIIELRFEADGAAPKVPIAQQVQLVVVDEYNQPVVNADVIIGPLERINWQARGRTDANGRLMLSVVSPGASGTAAGLLGLAQPAEAAVMRPGFTPQYIPSIQLQPGELLAVRLTRDDSIPSAQVAATVAPSTDQTPAPSPHPQYGSVEEHNNYYFYDDDDDYYDYYDCDRHYRRRYWPYGYWPGYVVVIRGDKDDNNNGNGNGDGNGGNGDDGNGENEDLRTPPIPLPNEQGRVVPWQTSPTIGVTPVPSHAVKVAPGVGVVSVPRYGVTSVPGVQVTTSPGQGFTPVPAQRVQPAPRSETISVPRTIEPPRRVSTPIRTPARVRQPSPPARVSRPARDVVRSAPPRMSSPSRVNSRPAGVERSVPSPISPVPGGMKMR